MILKPNNDYLVMELVEPVFKSGITLASGVGAAATMPGGYKRWKVIAAGPGRRSNSGEMIPMFFKVGDYVQAPTPIAMNPNAQTPQEQRLRMPCEWQIIPPPENEGKILVMARDAEMLAIQEGEIHPPPTPIERAPVDPRVRKAAEKALVH